MQIANHRLPITSWSGESQYNRQNASLTVVRLAFCTHKLMVYRMEQNPE